MTTDTTQIPDIWPDNRTEGLTRVLYNIALHRLGVTTAPNTKDMFFTATVNGKRYRLIVIARTTKNSFNTAIGKRFPRELLLERNESPAVNIALLAVWRDQKESPKDHTIRTWLIPSEVLEGTTNGRPNRGDGRWDVNIVRHNGPWIWHPTEGMLVDIDHTYDEWTMSGAEMRYVLANTNRNAATKGTRPIALVWSDGGRTELSPSTWREASIQCLRLALVHGLRESELPIKNQATPFTRSHEVAPGLHITVPNDREKSCRVLRDIARKFVELKKPTRLTQVEVADEGGKWLIDVEV